MDGENFTFSWILSSQIVKKVFDTMDVQISSALNTGLIKQSVKISFLSMYVAHYLSVLGLS